MLQAIKSYFFMRKLFSCLKECKKLDLVRYNKYIQKELNITIINYKIFSRRKKVIEKNGIGKEYDRYSGDLLFKGVYLNNKRNGKGKEFCNNLIFEGEYLNDKRNGKGKEYYYTKDLLFEGEYLNGKKWNGKG